MSVTALDLRDNIAALTIAICYQDYLLPEAAFGILAGEKYLSTIEDKEDMLRLKEEGLSFNEIGKLYGVTGSNVYKTLKRYQYKKETSLAPTRKGQE